jgi:hypothetical protein
LLCRPEAPRRTAIVTERRVTAAEKALWHLAALGYAELTQNWPSALAGLVRATSNLEFQRLRIRPAEPFLAIADHVCTTTGSRRHR